MACCRQTNPSRTVAAFSLLALLAVLVLLGGCASRPMTEPEAQQSIIAPPAPPSSPELFRAPAFVLAHTNKAYNRIGRVVAKGVQADERIGIDTGQPAIYVGSQRFTTARAAYTNLIFRIHFPEQPFSLVP